MKVEAFDVEAGDPSDWGIANAACVTVFEPRAREKVWSAVGAQAIERGVCGIDDKDRDDLDRLQLWRDGDWWIVLERNGFWGSIQENLLDAGCLNAASVFWNVNAVMRYLELRGGQVIREFDPGFLQTTECPPDAGFGTPFSSEQRLPFDEAPVAAALALLAGRFQVDVTANTLRKRRPTFAVPQR
ncbi:MAG: hypothetical protein AAGA48_14540 [Myxococcota bacterium]